MWRQSGIFLSFFSFLLCLIADARVAAMGKCTKMLIFLALMRVTWGTLWLRLSDSGANAMDTCV